MNYVGVGVGVVRGVVEEEFSLLYMGFWRTARVVCDIRGAGEVDGMGWLWSLWSCFSFSSICIIMSLLFKSSS